MRVVAALVTDIAWVFAFTLAMRVSHTESLDPLAVVQAAVPFLIGLAVGWVISRSWRTTLTLYAGLAVWLCTVGIGLVIRRVSMVGALPSFTMVALSVLGVTMLGWRLIVHLEIQRRRIPTP